MLLKLRSGFTIAVRPLFFWEQREKAALEIHSKGAFHPDHVTTRLSLELLEQDLRSSPCRRFLDIGCGSGVLGLAAARMGAHLVVGLDIAPRAIEVSRHNARRNNLSDTTHWVVGTTHAVRGPFDCIAANLPTAVVLEVLNDVTALVHPATRMILSGFHDIHWHIVDHLLTSKGLHTEKLISGDQSFYGFPPSGSFTWMAAWAKMKQ